MGRGAVDTVILAVDVITLRLCQLGDALNW